MLVILVWGEYVSITYLDPLDTSIQGAFVGSSSWNLGIQKPLRGDIV